MEPTNQGVANAIRKNLKKINLLVNRAKENNLVVKFTSNEFSLGETENLLEVEVYEKVMY